MREAKEGRAVRGGINYRSLLFLSRIIELKKQVSARGHRLPQEDPKRGHPFRAQSRVFPQLNYPLEK